jgi:hypothetical protein
MGVGRPLLIGCSVAHHICGITHCTCGMESPRTTRASTGSLVLGQVGWGMGQTGQVVGLWLRLHESGQALA